MSFQPAGRKAPLGFRTAFPRPPGPLTPEAVQSHHNNGAYWEAGFARGLGKPVIYMYNKEVGNSDKSHMGLHAFVEWYRDYYTGE